MGGMGDEKTARKVAHCKDVRLLEIILPIVHVKFINDQQRIPAEILGVIPEMRASSHRRALGPAFAGRADSGRTSRLQASWPLSVPPMKQGVLCPAVGQSIAGEIEAYR